jgi:hypothetical protein
MKFTRLTVFAAALACGLALSGCGKNPDDGIASAGQNQAQTQATGAPVSDDPQERARQFAQCMRDQGIDMPDPTFTDDGGMSIQIGPGEAQEGAVGIDPKQDMAKFEAAHKACQAYMPNGGEMGKADPEMEAKMREFAKCMRENGVENFPDPMEGGGIIIGGPNAEGGIDPSDPAFQAAQEKCAEFMPGKITKTGPK